MVLDVEDPVGRHSTGRGEDPHGAGAAAATGAGALICPVRSDRIGGASFRQAGYPEAVVGRSEGDVAVGANSRAVEALIVQRVGEWEGNDRADVIAVVA